MIMEESLKGKISLAVGLLPRGEIAINASERRYLDNIIADFYYIVASFRGNCLWLTYGGGTSLTTGYYNIVLRATKPFDSQN